MSVDYAVSRPTLCSQTSLCGMGLARTSLVLTCPYLTLLVLTCPYLSLLVLTCLSLPCAARPVCAGWGWPARRLSLLVLT